MPVLLLLLKTVFVVALFATVVAVELVVVAPDVLAISILFVSHFPSVWEEPVAPAFVNAVELTAAVVTVELVVVIVETAIDDDVEDCVSAEFLLLLLLDSRFLLSLAREEETEVVEDVGAVTCKLPVVIEVEEVVDEPVDVVVVKASVEV